MDNKLIILFYILLLCGCGQTNFSDDDANSQTSGSAKLVIHNSTSASTEKFSVIKKYVVTISGKGIESPIVKEFSGTEENGVVEGIPSGDARKVEVVAVNSESKPIRRGVTEDVTVDPGPPSSIDVSMSAVPIFVNLKDGNVVPIKRLRFELFSDPEDTLSIEEETNGSKNVLADISSNAAEVTADVTTGLAKFVPNNIDAGEHIFSVVSKRSGYSSSVKVRLLDIGDLRAAPLYNGGAVDVHGNYLGVSRIGAPISATPGSGAVWPRMLENEH